MGHSEVSSPRCPVSRGSPNPQLWVPASLVLLAPPVKQNLKARDGDETPVFIPNPVVRRRGRGTAAAPLLPEQN